MSRTGLWSVRDENNPKIFRVLLNHYINTHRVLPILDLQIQENAAFKLAHAAYTLEYASIPNGKTCALRRFKIKENRR